MVFDFDNPPSRSGTNAEKYTARERLFGREDVLPFWVADMEFAVAPAVQAALVKRMDHPVYGYTSIPASLLEAVTEWNEKRYGLHCATDSLMLIPGVMSGVSAALFALSKPGDAVVVQPPLYPPLMQTVSRNDRVLLENPLVLDGEKYRIHYGELERLFQRYEPKIFLFCSPHNPVGRVWSEDEVARVVELTRRYNVNLVSDEIHADIVYPPHSHSSALVQAREKKAGIIVLNSASKTFNVAGLNTAYAIIPDLQLRTAFRRQLRRMNLHGANLFGMTALESSYTSGEEWLEALLGYLLENRNYMADRLSSELPALEHFLPEGTYLFWLNFNSLWLSPSAIKERLIDHAGVGLNDGVTFSQAHEGYWRFNFAVPRSMLKEGLDRIIGAFL